MAWYTKPSSNRNPPIPPWRILDGHPILFQRNGIRVLARPHRRRYRNDHTTMLSGFLLFWRCVGRIVWPPTDSPVRWTRARVMAMAVWLPMCIVLGLLHWICLLLDEILFPRYRRIPVREPVFIVGPPRGGTTFLHRVLAKDRQKFTCFTFGEMVFTPSILQRKALGILAHLDASVGHPVEGWMRRFEKRFFDPYAYMHRVSLFEPEEDFVLLGYIFANPLLLTVFPFPDLMAALWRYDREVPRAEVDRMLHFYRRCVQRHLYCYGPDKQHLSKNPYFTSMMQGLDRAFPDAKFILNIRDPQQNVPSFLSIWKALYHDLGNDPKHPLAQEFILDWLRDTYLHGAKCLDTLSPDRGAIIPYDALVGSPRETIVGLYTQLGLSIGEDTEALLHAEEERALAYRSVHSYSAAEYGLNPEEIERRFAFVRERFGFGTLTTTSPGGCA